MQDIILQGVGNSAEFMTTLFFRSGNVSEWP